MRFLKTLLLVTCIGLSYLILIQHNIPQKFDDAIRNSDNNIPRSLKWADSGLDNPILENQDNTLDTKQPAVITLPELDLKEELVKRDAKDEELEEENTKLKLEISVLKGQLSSVSEKEHADSEEITILKQKIKYFDSKMNEIAELKSNFDEIKKENERLERLLTSSAKPATTTPVKLNGIKSNSLESNVPGSIKLISIRGERHSGTGWLRKMVSENCPKLEWKVDHSAHDVNRQGKQPTWMKNLDADGKYRKV